MTLIKEQTTPVGQITKLSNGLRAANFSSPHPFTFEDGSVIPAVNNNDSQRLKVNFNETIVETCAPSISPTLKEYFTVTLDFTLSDEVRHEMELWMELWYKNKIDIVLCPLPMIQALYDDNVYQGKADLSENTPFRAIRMKDRIKKLISIDTFTI